MQIIIQFIIFPLIVILASLAVSSSVALYLSKKILKIEYAGKYYIDTLLCYGYILIAFIITRWITLLFTESIIPIMIIMLVFFIGIEYMVKVSIRKNNYLFAIAGGILDFLAILGAIIYISSVFEGLLSGLIM